MDNCNTIYGLYSIHNIDSKTTDSIIHAISIDKIILEKMIPDSKDYPSCVKFEIKPIVYINLYKSVEKIKESEFVIELHDGYLNYINNLNNSLDKQIILNGKMYCFASNKYNLTHYILAGHEDQIIINFLNCITRESDDTEEIQEIQEIKKLKIFKNNISENSIKFNTYYEDGLMNA